MAVGSFSHIFSVVDAENGLEVSTFVLPNVIESTALASPCGKLLYIGCFDGKLYCLDYLTNKIAWSYATGDQIKSRPCFCNGDAIIVGSYDKYMHCVDSKVSICHQLFSIKNVVEHILYLQPDRSGCLVPPQFLYLI